MVTMTIQAAGTRKDGNHHITSIDSGDPSASTHTLYSVTTTTHWHARMHTCWDVTTTVLAPARMHTHCDSTTTMTTSIDDPSTSPHARCNVAHTHTAQPPPAHTHTHTAQPPPSACTHAATRPPPVTTPAPAPAPALAPP